MNSEDEQKRCYTCGRYRQHYGWDQGLYEIQMGHCFPNSRPKHPSPQDKACDQWISQTEEYKHRRLAPALRWKEL